MEVIERTIIYRRPDRFRIYPIGDIHAGSIHCAENDIKRIIQEIAQQRNTYWLGMGNYADCITKSDKRFQQGGLALWVKPGDIVESQRNWVVELLGPIKNKCLGMLTGNHEEDIHDKHDDDITRHICDDLGVCYGGYAAYINVTFSRNGGSNRLYQIHAWHGAGSAQTEGARLMRLMRLVNEFQADIYLMGHLHAMTQHTPDRIVCRRGRLKSIKLAATITGSWLKGYTQPKDGQTIDPTYIEKKGYKPSRIGCPIINIYPEKDEFTIES